jgi:hypothetical protein
MKRRREGGIPSMPRDLRFCTAWLEHLDLRKAWQEAGYSQRNKGWARRAQSKLKRFSGYLEPLQRAKAEKVAERLVICQGDVLQTMRAIAFANPLDFFEKTNIPETRELKDESGQIQVEPVMFNGAPVYRMMQKPFAELTSEQAMAVELIHGAGGEVLGYTLPSLKVRHQFLYSLGKNLGLWIDELAKQNHQQLHKHAHLHLDSAPTEKLAELEQRLVAIVGPDFARTLGLTSDEIDQALQMYGEQNRNTQDA